VSAGHTLLGHQWVLDRMSNTVPRGKSPKISQRVGQKENATHVMLALRGRLELKLKATWRFRRLRGQVRRLPGRRPRHRSVKSPRNEKGFEWQIQQYARALRLGRPSTNGDTPAAARSGRKLRNVWRLRTARWRLSGRALLRTTMKSRNSPSRPAKEKCGPPANRGFHAQESSEGTAFSLKV